MHSASECQDFARAFQTQLEDLAPGARPSTAEHSLQRSQQQLVHVGRALPEDDGEGPGESLEDTATGEIPEVITCSAAIGGCIEDSWQQSLAFSDWVFDGSSCSIDVAVLNAAISTWSRSSWLGAVDAFGTMRQSTFRPNVVSYGAAVACGTWTAAAWLLKESYQHTLGSPVACSAAISACEKGSFWQRALTLLELACVESVQRTVVCYNAACSACEKGKSWQATLALLASTALQPNVITYNAAISAGKQTNQWIQSLSVFSQLCWRFYPDTITCNSIIAAFDRRWQEAVQLLMFLQIQGLKANVVTFASTIQACSKAKEWQQALQLLVESQRLGVQTDPVMYNTLLRGCPLQTACGVLADMRAGAMQPSMLAYDVVMQACSDEGQQEDLWQFLVSTAEERSALEFLWGLALLSCSQSEVINDACVEALVEAMNRSKGSAELGFHVPLDRFDSFSTNELSCLWWSTAMLGAQNPQLNALLTDQTAIQIADFELDELVTTALGAATTSLPLACLMQRRVKDILQQLATDSFVLTNLGMHVLGVVFSCQLSDCLSRHFLRSVQVTLSKTGRMLDQQLGSWKETAIDNLRPSALQLERASEAPAIPMMLKDCGIAVLLKPPDWEVYGGHTERQLLSFVKDSFGSAPIFSDASHSCGFLHRLDVPSSGLVLISMTYEAHYELQVQLHAGQIQRDYLVLSHGIVPVDRKSVGASVVWHGDGPTYAGGRGRTAQTLLCAKRYAMDFHFRSFSELEVQIITGRKHQIRSHLAHLGFPVVGDGTYASYETFLLDRGITGRHWLHRYRLTFSANGKRQVELDAARSTMPVPTTPAIL
eukprot:Skav202604  [mRNA]  locus=scaffold2348:134102:139813:+ [translate_table: standard]